MASARLIIDPPQAGDWNMAVDEALLASAEEGKTTLRLYQWQEATLSLGYFQSAEQRVEHDASRKCPLVRRTTGGGAIVHDRELTYSLTLPVAERFSQTLGSLYAAVHESLIAALAELGVQATLCGEKPLIQLNGKEPFLCFQRRAPGDVLVGDVKVCGSAQRRQRGGLLQHGSILLARSLAAPELDGIGEVAGSSLRQQEFASRWSAALQNRLGCVFQAGTLSQGEFTAARRLQSGKFGAQAWTFRR